MSITQPSSPRRAGRLRVLPAVATAVTVCVALLAGWLPGRDGAKLTGRAELQRILDDAVAARHRLAPGATAFVSGPHGTCAGSAGVADIATREALRPGARMRLQSHGERCLHRVRDGELRAQLRAIARRLAANPATEVSPLWLIRLAAWQPLLFEPGSHDQISGPHARGYQVADDGTMTDATNWHWGAGAAAGIVSSAPETAAFLVVLMRGNVLDARSLKRMRHDVWHGGSDSGCAGNAYGWVCAGDAYKADALVSADGSRVAVLLLMPAEAAVATT